MKKLTNDWKCSKELHKFYDKYCIPLSLRVEKGMEVFTDTNYKWDSVEQKSKASENYKKIETQSIDFHTLNSSVLEMIDQHESLVSLISELYSSWYNKVSRKGIQPKEMLSMQAEELHNIFVKLHEVLEPLNLEINKPLNFK